MSQKDKNNQKDPNTVNIDPATVVLIGGILILLPLLFTGFLSQ